MAVIKSVKQKKNKKRYPPINFLFFSSLISCSPYIIHFRFSIMLLHGEICKCNSPALSSSLNAIFCDSFFSFFFWPGVNVSFFHPIYTYTLSVTARYTRWIKYICEKHVTSLLVNLDSTNPSIIFLARCCWENRTHHHHHLFLIRQI